MSQHRRRTHERGMRRASSRWNCARLTLALVLAPVSAALAQVTDLKDHLYCVSAVGNDQAWAGGAFGSLYHTADSGRTWSPQTSGTAENIFGIDFIDADNGWAVGRSGTILVTHDGGKNWTRQQAPKDRHLFNVEGVTREKAIAIGDWGTILVTTDGGATWQDRTLDRDVILNDQSWPDADHGWVVGEAGAMFATSDGGTTWQELNSGVFKTLYGVTFQTAKEGWAAGLDGLILATSDGGVTWAPVHGEAEVSGLEQVGSHAGVENPHLYAIAAGEGRALAVGENTGIFSSSDNGRTWKSISAPRGADLRWLRALAVGSGGRAYMVGAHGLVLGVEGDQMKIVSE